MKMLIKTLGLAMISLCLGNTPLFAQQALGTAGGDIQSAEGSVAFTIGQVAYQNQADGTFTQQQGVQQPFEIYEVSVFEWSDRLEVKAFPNPAFETLIVEGDLTSFNNVSYSLYGANGSLVLSGKITSLPINIDVSGLPKAMYTLQISSPNEGGYSSIIIKN